MLLRRITEHVRTQNWFAVGIDFVIVVLGVFVGLQVSGWNEERQNRIAETYYLQRILGDIDQSISNNEAVLEFLSGKSINAYWVAKKLREGQIRDDERVVFETRFLDIEDWRTGDFIDSALVELQTKGQLGIVQSRGFHEQLAIFKLELESYHRAQNNLADFLKTLTLHLSTHVDRVKTDAFHRGLRDGTMSRVESNALHRERVLLNSYEDMAANPQLLRILDQYAEFYYWRQDNVIDLQLHLNGLREVTLAALEQASGPN